MERSCLWLDPWQSQSGLVCWGLWEGLCQSGAHQGPADNRRTAPRGSVRCHSSLSQLGPLPQTGVSQMCLSTLLYFLKSQIWSCHIPTWNFPIDLLFPPSKMEASRSCWIWSLPRFEPHLTQGTPCVTPPSTSHTMLCHPCALQCLSPLPSALPLLLWPWRGPTHL